ncbi:iron ABC transporter permease [Alkalinema sp. FACHB-956]|nr:iron ABC transporter permease [Alkalinema sp. FACHB-956]
MQPRSTPVNSIALWGQSIGNWLWIVTIVGLAIVLSSPIWAILGGLWVDSGEVWQNLATTVLPTYVMNSLWLMVGVGVGVTAIGTGTAWLVTLCRFPGRRLFEWALLLPLAAPSYILAYTYTELLDYYGPIQTQLRQLFGWESAADYWFPNVRSLPGAILMLTLVLYPYVYLIARSAFLTQSVVTLEASRSLGCNPWQSFFRVAIPLARPAIIAGLSLALMETLNDFGTVEFFSVQTFTTGIYRTWFDMGEQGAALQLALCLLGFILVLIVLERLSRGQAKYYQTANRIQDLSRYSLGWGRSLLAWIACGVPLTLGFLVPAGLLAHLTWINREIAFDSQFIDYAQHSFGLSLMTAGIAMTIAVVMNYGKRLHSTWITQVSTQVASLGYAVPSAIVVIGILMPLGKVDQAIGAWLETHWSITTGLLVSGTVTALIFAYIVRFLAVAMNSVEASLTNIKPSLDEAARSLGEGWLGTLWRVHIPLLRSGLLTAILLVFVDVMKELPATLIVRPFNFDTLAVRVYNLAADERLAEAAGSALAIVVVGLVPVILLSWQMTRSRQVQ